jgi:hypothetical protein
VKSNHNKNRKFFEINDKLIFSFKASSNRLMFPNNIIPPRRRKEEYKEREQIKIYKTLYFLSEPLNAREIYQFDISE